MKDLLSHVGLLVTVSSLIMSLLLALQPGGPGSGGPDSDSPGEDVGYVLPEPGVQARLSEISNEVAAAVTALRLQEHGQILQHDPVLQLAAQQHAERTAVLGELVNSPHNVAMVQHSLPLEAASGHAVMDAWLRSAPHTEVLLDQRYFFSGIGVAYGHGRVWVALQLSAP